MVCGRTDSARWSPNGSHRWSPVGVVGVPCGDQTGHQPARKSDNTAVVQSPRALSRLPRCIVPRDTPTVPRGPRSTTPTDARCRRGLPRPSTAPTWCRLTYRAVVSGGPSPPLSTTSPGHPGGASRCTSTPPVRAACHRPAAMFGTGPLPLAGSRPLRPVRRSVLGRGVRAKRVRSALPGPSGPRLSSNRRPRGTSEATTCVTGACSRRSVIASRDHCPTRVAERSTRPWVEAEFDGSAVRVSSCAHRLVHGSWSCEFGRCENSHSHTQDPPTCRGHPRSTRTSFTHPQIRKASLGNYSVNF